MYDSSPIFSKRTVLGTLFIFIGVFFCLGVTMVSVFTPCIYNYYTHMLVYPDAEYVGQENSLINYFGFGELNTTWFVEEDAELVFEWYERTMFLAERAKRRAIIDQTEIPPVWGGIYEVVPSENGARIILRADCY